MAKSREITSIRDVLNKILKYNKNLPDIEFVVLKKKWGIIVGEDLYKHTEPDRIYKNTLYVKCTHQGWINTLLLYKKEILEKINKNVTDSTIRDIKFFYKRNN
mgnify:CR=1 FL=1